MADQNRSCRDAALPRPNPSLRTSFLGVAGLLVAAAVFILIVTLTETEEASDATHLYGSNDAHVLGSASAPVKIVEFSDFQ